MQFSNCYHMLSIIPINCLYFCWKITLNLIFSNETQFSRFVKNDIRIELIFEENVI